MSALFSLIPTSSRLAYIAQPLSDIDRLIFRFDSALFPLPPSLDADFVALDGSFLRFRSRAKKFCDLDSRDDDDEVFCARHRGPAVVESFCHTVSLPSTPVCARSTGPEDVGGSFLTCAFSCRSMPSSSFERPLTSV